ncbi:phenylacetone monooxygenase [Colletotrichum incanum]|nr:phenylacetone monooxygenase [Colletotrichum incanum]
MSATELFHKYQQERQKRLRPEGAGQYADFRDPTIGDKLGNDPWVNKEEVQAHYSPLNDTDSIKFMIVSAGHAGLLHAVRLIEAGFKTEDIVIVDTAGGFGGTWYWNRYPGLMCDVEGYIYLPLLEETGYVPKHKYSYGAEIRGQSERVAKHYGLRAQFCTRLTHHQWKETKRRWTIKLTQDLGRSNDPVHLTVETQFFISAAGILNIPHYPKLPGFKDLVDNKKVFHSARWDWQYTGGSQVEPNMVNLRGKKVGIIGTGATAIQIVPELAKWAAHLYVFQRTPTFVGPRNQRETTPAEWEKVAYKKGWQYERQDNFHHFVTNDPVPENMVDDGWTHPDSHSIAGFLGSATAIITPDGVQNHIRSMYELDVPRAERLRAHVANVVKDPETAKKLQAWYGGWCKRPAFNDDYLQAFNRPNVTLVDTDGKGVDSFDASGVVANGTLYELDVLVLATGFYTRVRDRSPAAAEDAPVVGRDGVLISEKYLSPEYGTLYGVATNGFPNLFWAGASGGSGISYNLTSAYDVFSRLIAHVIADAHKRADDAGNIAIEPTKEAEDRYGDEVQKRALWLSVMATCTPGWFSGEGEGALEDKTPEQKIALARHAPWGSGPLDYKRRVLEYISKGGLDGFEVRV